MVNEGKKENSLQGVRIVEMGGVDRVVNGEQNNGCKKWERVNDLPEKQIFY